MQNTTSTSSIWLLACHAHCTLLSNEERDCFFNLILCSTFLPLPLPLPLSHNVSLAGYPAPPQLLSCNFCVISQFSDDPWFMSNHLCIWLELQFFCRFHRIECISLQCNLPTLNATWSMVDGGCWIEIVKAMPRDFNSSDFFLHPDRFWLHKRIFLIFPISILQIERAFCCGLVLPANDRMLLTMLPHDVLHKHRMAREVLLIPQLVTETTTFSVGANGFLWNIHLLLGILTYFMRTFFFRALCITSSTLYAVKLRNGGRWWLDSE